MRVADTSALYALFSVTDAHHARARVAFEDPEPIQVPPEILSETLALLQFRHSFGAARKAGAFLRSLPHVAVEPPSSQIIDASWTTFIEAAGKLSYPDATVVSWCLALGARAIAFDRAITSRT